MRLAAGVIATAPVVATPGTSSLATLVNFSFTPKHLSPLGLVDVNWAAPGRYAGEMLRRLQRHVGGEEQLVVNPRFAPEPGGVARLVGAALCVDPRADAAVIADARGRTAALLFRRAVDDADIAFLAALSALDPALDAELLRAGFGWRVESVSTPDVDLGAVHANGFLLGSFNPEAAALPARLAVEALAPGGPDGDADARRRALAHVVVLPFHAGDVLFLCQAIQAHPTVSAVVTLEAFAPIVRDVLPWVDCVAVNEPVPPRGSDVLRDEIGYTAGLLQRARDQRAAQARPLDGVFHLFRPHRDYNHSHLHLRDGFVFALGGDPERALDAWPPGRGRRRHLPCKRSRRERVVLHLDGGWALKSFPPASRPELVARLRAEGFDPVVLGPPDAALDGCRFEPFSGLAAYRTLLADTAAVVGVDSFPAHYAVHYGVPTVHVFASTHPRNSAYPGGDVSRTLHRAHPCVPCNDPVTCALDGGPVCHATPSPEEIVAAVLDLIGRPAADVTAEDALGAAAELAREVQDALAAPFPPPVTLATGGERDALVAKLHADFPLEPVERCPLCGASERSGVGEKLGIDVVACTACGLLYAARRIAEADLPRFYGAGYWSEFMSLHGYPTASERYAFDYRRATERVAYCRALVEPGRALDVGCGLGAFVRRLAEHGFAAAGWDMPEIAALARSSSGVRVVTALPPGERFTLVTAFDVLEHLYDPAATLQRLAGALEPGGVVVVETFRTDCPEFERAGLAHEDVKPFEHPHMFRERHLRTLLERAGLEPLALQYPDGPERARVRLAGRLRAR